MDGALLREVWSGVGGDAGDVDGVVLPERTGLLPSSFDVEGLAIAAFAALGVAARGALGGTPSTGAPGDIGGVLVDAAGACAAVCSERLVRIDGSPPASPWSPVSRVFEAADGWVRLHGNYPQHRSAIERATSSVDVDALARRIRTTPADVVEAAVIRAGGAAAAARTEEQWRQHAHGSTVLTAPLVETAVRDDVGDRESASARPLRVLELAKVIAGPTAGRSLAWFGADVVRVEAPGHEEVEAFVVDQGIGKRSVELDLRSADGRRAFLDLLADADVFVHSARPGALERLGLGVEERSLLRPGLIDASLSAFGRTGGWAGRRGFDSLVQVASGVDTTEALAAGVEPGESGLPEPRALPCQILDHATGILLAAAVLRAVGQRDVDGRGRTLTASLARTAALLSLHGGRTLDPNQNPSLPSASLQLEGPLGATTHVPVPVTVDGITGGWTSAPPLRGSSDPVWSGR